MGGRDVSITRSHVDTQVITLCHRMVAICHEQDAQVRANDHQPSVATERQLASLAAALTKTAPPTTPEGIQAVAELAMVFADRTDTDILCSPETFGDWLKILALTSAAGKRETIPLPSNLPKYWPE